jgi:hypothetical protein
MLINVGNLKNFDFAKKAWKWVSDAYKKLWGGKPPDADSGLIVSAKPNISDIGNLYMFGYDALHKDKLPYWDSHPLIIYMGPSKKRPSHFLGLNLHYLPPVARVGVLNTLDTIKENDKFNEQIKFQASYEYLQRLSIFPEIKVCIKEYIPERVFNSYYLKIEPKSWERIVGLPLQQWNINKGTPPS